MRQTGHKTIQYYSWWIKFRSLFFLYEQTTNCKGKANFIKDSLHMYNVTKFIINIQEKLTVPAPVWKCEVEFFDVFPDYFCWKNIYHKVHNDEQSHFRQYCHSSPFLFSHFSPVSPYFFSFHFQQALEFHFAAESRWSKIEQKYNFPSKRNNSYGNNVDTSTKTLLEQLYIINVLLFLLYCTEARYLGQLSSKKNRKLLSSSRSGPGPGVTL